MQYVPEIFGGKIPKTGVGKWVRVFTVKPSVATHQPLKFKKGNFPNRLLKTWNTLHNNNNLIYLYIYRELFAFRTMPRHDQT